MNEKKQHRKALGTREVGAVITASVGLIIIYVALMDPERIFPGRTS